MSGILNSLNKFLVVSVSPIILNITFIFFSIISTYINKNIAYILSYAVLVGGVLQFLWMFIFTVKNKILLFPVYPKIDEMTKKFFKNFLSGIIGYGIVEINSIVDSIMVSGISGAISYLYYSTRILQLPLALIGTAISTSILPLLSKKIALKSEKIFKIQENAIFIGLFLALPCVVGIYFLANLAIPILFERGGFTAEDSLAVVNCLKIYAFALPSFVVTKILQTIYYANKDVKTPMLASLSNLIVNVTLNLIMARFIGYLGVLISTVFSSLINVFILFFILLKQKRIIISDLFRFKMLKLIYVLIFMILTMVLCNKFIILKNNSYIFRFLKLSVTGIFGGIVYLALSLYLRIIDKEFARDVIAASD
jgi:putative peptidoglycan lipid II flippase